MPSSRRQIAAASAALVAVASISGRLTAARARNRATAGFSASASGSVSSSAGTGSGSTQITRSRGTPIAIRLVARIVSPGVRASRSVRAGATARTCSTVSRTSRLGARPSASASDSTSGRPGSATPIAPAIAGSTSEASLTPSRGTNAIRPSRRGIARRDTSTARRLLPTPPIPASVTNARSRPRTRRRSDARSASRPISGAPGTSGSAPGQHGSTTASPPAAALVSGPDELVSTIGCMGGRGYDALGRSWHRPQTMAHRALAAATRRRTARQLTGRDGSGEGVAATTARLSRRGRRGSGRRPGSGSACRG